MKRTTFFGGVTLSLLVGSVAFAATPTSQVGPDFFEGDLRREKVSIAPVVGVLAYENSVGVTDSRLAEGLNLNLNLLGWAGEENPSGAHLALNTGLVFSHLGTQGSNFVGTDPSGPDVDSSANFFLIPANAKLGVNLSPSQRLSAHGGVNVTYRSIASSIAAGDDADAPATNIWTAYPNVGLDYEVRFSRNFNGILRPDLTFTPGSLAFAGLIGASFTFE